jgi:hypothetical protein
MSKIKDINTELEKLLSVADRIQERKTANLKGDLLRNYKRFLETIKQRLSNLYGNLNDPEKFYPDAYSFNRLNNLQNQIKEEIVKLHLQDAELVKFGIKDSFTSSFYNTNHALETALGMPLNFGTLPVAAIESVISNPLDLIGWPNRSRENIMQMTTGIRDEIVQGLTQGKGYAETARAITDKMNIGASKAFRIVSTETGRAQSDARLKSFSASEAAARKLGLNSHRIWKHSDGIKQPRDGSIISDINHIEMDGVAAKEDGYFYLPSGVKTMGPKLSGEPSEDIFCHCTMIMQFSKK